MRETDKKDTEITEQTGHLAQSVLSYIRIYKYFLKID